MINGCSRTLVPLVKDPLFLCISMEWIPFNDQLMLEYISTLSERPPLSSLFHGNGFTFMINWCSSLLVALVKDHPIRVYLMEWIHFHDQLMLKYVSTPSERPHPIAVYSMEWIHFHDQLMLKYISTPSERPPHSSGPPFFFPLILFFLCGCEHTPDQGPPPLKKTTSFWNLHFYISVQWTC